MERLKLKKAVFFAHILEAAKQENLPLGDVLTTVKGFGFEAVECDYADIEANPIEFKKTLDEAGLKVSSIYKFCDFGNNIDEKELRAFISDVSYLESKKALIIPGFITDQTTKDHDIAEMIRGLNLVCDIAEEKGTTITLEDFDDIQSPCCTKDGLRHFMDNVPKLKYTFDTGNFYYCNTDELDAFEFLKDRLAHVHLKDRAISEINPGEKDKETISGKTMYASPVGSGVINIRECINRALMTGYEDYFTAEHFGSVKELEYMKRSADYLNSLTR